MVLHFCTDSVAVSGEISSNNAVGGRSDFQLLRRRSFQHRYTIRQTLLICVFRGGRWGCASPNRSKFLQRVYSAASTVDWTATAEEQRLDNSTAAISVQLQ